MIASTKIIDVLNGQQITNVPAIQITCFETADYRAMFVKVKAMTSHHLLQYALTTTIGVLDGQQIMNAPTMQDTCFKIANYHAMFVEVEVKKNDQEMITK